MNQPKLYLKQTKLPINETEEIFTQYFHLINQNKHCESTLLDIGCGPGRITRDVFYSLFEEPVSKVVGIDVTKEMIDFANSLYANETFSFEMIDIAKEVPQKYVSYFDYVFSSWTLHWIRDQKKLYANINQIMKPGGQLLLQYIAQSILFDIYQEVWHKPDYSSYITDFYVGQSCFQKSEDPKTEVETILKNAGFQIKMLKIEPAGLNSISASDLKEFLGSINPVLQQIPDHLKEQFLGDHLRKFQTDCKLNDSNNYYYKCNIFVICATKK